ncbi:EMBRYO SURROUNDING FACTOR 1-like protein 1 [Capsella rubella]|uniref:EMBRYO SURROUNDING FACTOR 1-like protein 1 n=1 Tax=Capsella rubella TaxID=81985 RepID=UPI000CD5146F|nr:EMBRYO SURROUNDING FACTOR 1-like protein 1 [Capsella rubella]
MKTSQIVLMCIVMFSLLALHECGRIERGVMSLNVGKAEPDPDRGVGGGGGRIERGVNVGKAEPDCRKERHHKMDCWCCHLKGVQTVKCWLLDFIPTAREICLASCHL